MQVLNPEYKEAMRSNYLFMDIEEGDFATILQGTSVCELSAGEILFSQKQPATEFFLLVEGKIKISLLSFEGTQKVVDIINPGNTFAEVIILNGMEGYPVNAKALSNAKVLRINAEKYIQVLSNSSEACLKVIGRLSARLHWLMNEMERLSLHNASYRLISYLLEDIPHGSVEETKVILGAPKRIIASRISVTPETFSRTLKSLSQDELIEVYDEHILVKDPSKLREMLFI
ncbi:transcriptional regulator Dnr [Cocleimonas flava]|uniref:CRP-like cAMP-binding protein n=1 Tax=Cocleimonas flava TaxID=634765 RepID=A0A4R1F904_9GAMM|nr:Crp/Fnr family transcriptional regulator [Cocleimonas flava]TCJ88338.1 CRP-like cAMP-binding protein [Cocleimonas flava]